MKAVVLGLGIQGRKRLAVSGKDVVATADPSVSTADYKRIEEVPLKAYQAALVCVPDGAKLEIVRYLVSHGKHVLVEKPLLADQAGEIQEIQKAAGAGGIACYTAYNHRFEPHIRNLKKALEDGAIGDPYWARMFYGNGTACDVKNSVWRDRGAGVLADLGSHLLDLVLFLFGDRKDDFTLWQSGRFENRAPDQACFGSSSKPALTLETTLLSWKNTFSIDVFGSSGSVHLDGLCKWGPSTLRVRRRVLPSGAPEEKTDTLSGPDPTWEEEYRHFKALCKTGGDNLANCVWISTVLKRLARSAGSGLIE